MHHNWSSAKNIVLTTDHMPNLIIWKGLIKIYGFPIQQHVNVPILRKCYYVFRINIVFTTVVFEIRTRPNYWLIIEWNDNKARLGMQSKLSKILAKIHIKQCMFEGLGVAIYWKRVEVFSQWNVITKHTDTSSYAELFEQKCRMI